MDNVTVEGLAKIHGDKAGEVYREIQDKGGFGSEMASASSPVASVIIDQVRPATSLARSPALKLSNTITRSRVA